MSTQLYDELIDDYTEPMEELMRLDQSFQKEVDSIQEQSKQIEHSLNNLTQDISRLNIDKNNLSITHAKTIALQEVHKQKIKDLNELVATVAAENNMTEYSNPPLTAAKIRTFMDQVTALQNNKKEEINNFKKLQTEKEVQYNSKLDNLKSQYSHAQESVKMKKKQQVIGEIINKAQGWL